MESKEKTARPRGRPRDEKARTAVLEATWELLQTASLRDLTIVAVAEASGVSKPTIYKWWASKGALAVDAFLNFSLPQIRFRDKETVAEAIEAQVLALVRLYRGPTGRIVADLIAEGRSDTDALEAFRELFLARRRAVARELLEQGIARGELAADLDVEVALDLVYGPIYYRLLVGHQRLTDRFARSVVRNALDGLRARPRSLET